MAGEQSVSVRFDEIEAAWNVIDSVEQLHMPLYSYMQASNGPQELEQFTRTNKVRWSL